MLPKGIKFAYAVAMIAAVALAFIVSRNLDEATTRGHSLTLSVQRTGDHASTSRAADAVEAFSRSHHVNVGRLYYDPLNNSVRRIYLSVGDARADSAHWLTSGYPYFSRDAKVEVRSFSEIEAVAADGLYFVYGPESLTYELGGTFRSLGYDVYVEPNYSVLDAVRDSGNRALIWCFLVIGLVVVVAVASAVALNGKSYGVQRLQGQSWTAMMRRDFRQLVPFAGMVVTAVASVTAVSLAVYNHLHQGTTFARVAVSIGAVYVVTALLAHLLTAALVQRGSIVDAIKGELTAGWAIVGSYVLRCWSVLLIFSIGTSAIASAIELNREGAAYRTWTAMVNAYYMRISGAVMNPGGGEQAQSRIGQWIRSADTRDEVSIACRQTLPGAAVDVLVVNNRYLSTHAVYIASGARVQPESGNAIRVLIPERYTAETSRVVTGVALWVKSQDATSRDRQLPKIAVETARNNQTQVSYTTSADNDTPSMRDPIVLVLTGASGVITDGEYVTMAGNQGVLIENPTEAMKDLTALGVGDYVLGMSPYAEDAAERLRDAKRDFAVQVFNVLAGIAVLLATALGVTMIYLGRNSQTIFVKFISGWGFLRTHWRLLAVECVLGLSLLLWVWRNTAVVLQRQAEPGAPPMSLGGVFLNGWQPLVAGAVALCSLAMITVTLSVANTKFVRSRSARLS